MQDKRAFSLQSEYEKKCWILSDNSGDWMVASCSSKSQVRQRVRYHLYQVESPA